MDLGITTKIGGTPIYNLNIDGYNIWAKAEFLNPSGSVKDRPIDRKSTRLNSSH